MRIVAWSDTHMLHERVEVPPGDVLIHAGDLTEKGLLSDVERFDAYLATLPHRHKIVIAGNHDFCFERSDEARKLIRHAIYLQDEAVELDGVRFYGSPWQPEFFDWAFNLPRGARLREKWDLIPPQTDVLITHGPPFGHGDRTTRGEHVGCADLLERIAEIKPRLHIFGHIHEGYGITQDAHTTYANASTCTVGYKANNPPLILDL